MSCISTGTCIIEVSICLHPSQIIEGLSSFQSSGGPPSQPIAPGMGNMFFLSPPPPPPDDVSGKASRSAGYDGGHDDSNRDRPVVHDACNNSGNVGGPVELGGISNGNAQTDSIDQIGSRFGIMAPDGIGAEKIGGQDAAECGGQDSPPPPPPNDS